MPGRPGYTFFITEDGEEIYWKDCEIAGCERQVCIRADDRFCFAHMPEWKQKAYLAMVDGEERNGK